MTVLGALTSWALEGSVVTADSMRSRGYGSAKRTSFMIYRMNGIDVTSQLDPIAASDFLNTVRKINIELGTTVIITEHRMPLMLELWVEYMFRNPYHAQLIFTTHNTELLNMELIRKDQIYFADKSRKDGSSSLYSISKFATPTTENVRKGYLMGKYGATPNVEIETIE